jgi:hypothetical protein
MMTKISRKLASASVLAAALLLPFSARAADNFLAAVDSTQVPNASTSSMGTSVPINAAITVPLSVACSVGNVTAINSAVASAQTPQQAARLFAKIVSPAIGQAVANAVQQMLVQSESQSSVNPPTATSQIQGWQELILQNGLAVTLNWPSPGLATAGNLPVALLQARTAPSASGAFMTVSVNGTF